MPPAAFPAHTPFLTERPTAKQEKNQPELKFFRHRRLACPQNGVWAADSPRRRLNEPSWQKRTFCSSG
jgi:hypothetical protein